MPPPLPFVDKAAFWLFYCKNLQKIYKEMDAAALTPLCLFSHHHRKLYMQETSPSLTLVGLVILVLWHKLGVLAILLQKRTGNNKSSNETNLNNTRQWQKNLCTVCVLVVYSCLLAAYSCVPTHYERKD